MFIGSRSRIAILSNRFFNIIKHDLVIIVNGAVQWRIRAWNVQIVLQLAVSHLHFQSQLFFLLRLLHQFELLFLSDLQFRSRLCYLSSQEHILRDLFTWVLLVDPQDKQLNSGMVHVKHTSDSSIALYSIVVFVDLPLFLSGEISDASLFEFTTFLGFLFLLPTVGSVFRYTSFILLGNGLFAGSATIMARAFLI